MYIKGNEYVTKGRGKEGTDDMDAKNEGEEEEDEGAAEGKRVQEDKGWRIGWKKKMKKREGR